MDIAQHIVYFRSPVTENNAEVKADQEILAELLIWLFPYGIRLTFSTVRNTLM